MNHEMRVFPENFEKIRLGQKCREYRLYDEKRRKIMPGDTITFYNTKTKESVIVLVESLHIYKILRNAIRIFGMRILQIEEKH